MTVEQHGQKLPDQIESHSAMLTNQRIDIIIKTVDSCKYAAWSKPTLANVQAYFASLYTVFDSVFMLFDTNDKDGYNETKELGKMLNDYWSNFCQLRKDEENIAKSFQMLQICDRINRQLRAVLQRYMYFFKIAKMDVKNIHTGLEMINAGGGIFGGIPKASGSSGSVQGDGGAVPESGEDA